jgi:Ca2+/Na+ antiporter
MIVFGQMEKISPLHCIVMISMYLVYVTLTLREANERQPDPPLMAESSNEQSRERADSQTSQATARLSRSSLLSFAKEGNLDLATKEHDHAVAATKLADEPLFERIKIHMGYDPDAGIMDKMGFVASFVLRPLFALTLATNSWDPIISPLLPLGMGIFAPFGSKGLCEAVLTPEVYTDDVYERVYVVSIILGAISSAVVFFLSSRSPDKSTYHFPKTYAWMTFVMSVLWLGLLANEILDALTVIADMFNISKINAGITFLAWGNCIDNVFATVGLAKAREFGVAITGIYAAPMFNVLFGQGITLLFVTLMKKGNTTEFVMSTSATIILCTLVVILTCTLLYTRYCGWRMTRSLGLALGVAYPTVLAVAFAVGGEN